MSIVVEIPTVTEIEEGPDWRLKKEYHFTCIDTYTRFVRESNKEGKVHRSQNGKVIKRNETRKTCLISMKNSTSKEVN